MQIQVQRLREALDLLRPAVPKKHPMPVLQNVLLKDGLAMANRDPTPGIIHHSDQGVVTTKWLTKVVEVVR